MSKTEKIYIAVTADAYELPICVADSIKELAYMLDADYTAVTRLIKRGSKSRSGYRCYAVSLVSDDMDKEQIEVA